MLSAHRTPHDTVAYVEAAEQAGVEVFIACAGMSARTSLASSPLTPRGPSSACRSSRPRSTAWTLLSTVMMPPGVPVGHRGHRRRQERRFLAARILAGSRPELRERLVEQLAEGKKRYDSPVPGAPAQADELGKRAGEKRKK